MGSSQQDDWCSKQVIDQIDRTHNGAGFGESSGCPRSVRSAVGHCHCVAGINSGRKVTTRLYASTTKVAHGSLRK